jgi:hypothetical protein
MNFRPLLRLFHFQYKYPSTPKSTIVVPQNARLAARSRYPMPNSSDASSGVPQRRQMTDEQSPQVSGSIASAAQTGQ